MKKKYLIVLPALALAAVLGSGTALAYGGGRGDFMAEWQPGVDSTVASQRWEQHMKKQASLLGISVVDLKNYWSQGKTIQDILKDKGISQTDYQAKVQADHLNQLKQNMQSLVSNGYLTQAQADARIQFMTSQLNNHNHQGYFGLGRKMMNR